MARSEPWFLPLERCAAKAERRREEQEHLSELTFALEYERLFKKAATSECT